MRLTINGHLQAFTDLRTFRTTYDLSATFGVAHFEPKDFTDLARIDQAGDALKQVRTTMLNAIPDQLTTQQLMTFADLLTTAFRNALLAVNDQVKLKPIEVDFAVDGFRGVISTVTFECIRAAATHADPPQFMPIYSTWLNEGVRVSAQQHAYTHQDHIWTVQIVNTAYGRAGMIITTPEQVHYVADQSLGCPAEGFMFNLLKSAAEAIIRAT